MLAAKNRRFLGIGNRKKELLGKVSANELAHCNLVAPQRGIFGNNDCYCVYALYLVCQQFLGFPDAQQSTGVHFLYLPNWAIHPPQLCLGLRSQAEIRRKLDLQKVLCWFLRSRKRAERSLDITGILTTKDATILGETPISKQTTTVHRAFLYIATIVLQNPVANDQF